jgi:hypothetical protein
MSLPIPSQDVQNEAKKVVEGFVDYAKTKREERIKKLDTLHKNYAVKEGDSNYPGRAKNVDSFSHEAVETVVPRIFEVLTQNGELRYEVGPVGEEDKNFTKKSNALIAHDLKMAGGRKKLLEAVRYIVKCGTGVHMTPWDKQVRRRLTPRYSIKGVKYEGDAPIYQEVLDGYELTETPIHEGVGLELVDLRSCYLDPFEPDVQKAQAIVHESNIPFENLKREEMRRKRIAFQELDEFGRPRQAYVERVVGHYFNLPELKKKLATGTQVKEEAAGEQQNRDQTPLTPYKRAKVKHYYGRFDKGDGKEAEYIIAIAEDDLVIRCDVSDLPERPYLVSRYIPINGQTYGLGLLEILQTSQVIQSDILNQYLDNVTQILCSMRKRIAGGGVTDDVLVFTPFGIVDVDDMEDLQPLETPYVTGTALEALTYGLNRQRDAVGAPPILQGAQMKTNTTATEVQEVQTGAMARIIVGAINIEEEFIGPLLQRIIEYNYKFMGREKLVRITNERTGEDEFDSVTPEDLAGMYDYTPMGARLFQKKIQHRRDWESFLMNVANITNLNPDVLADMGFNLGLLIREIADTYDLPNIDKVFQGVEEGQPALPEPGNGETDPVNAAIAQLTGGQGV